MGAGLQTHNINEEIMNEPLPGDLASPSAPFGPYGQRLFLACKALSVAGGLLFVALVGMSIVSIVGRKLISAPVPGDVEVLQMVAAAASASFFAYCHMNQGDVKVDFFTSKASHRTVHYLDTIASAMVGAFGSVLTWRVWVGAQSTLESQETSAILGWSVGAAQLAMVPGFLLLALAGMYMTIWHFQQARTTKQGDAA